MVADGFVLDVCHQVVKELVAIFPVLRDWIAEFLVDNNNMVACEIGHNMLIEQVCVCVCVCVCVWVCV